MSATPQSNGAAPAAKLPVFGGRYMLLRKLAQGGMAEVFLARTIGAAGFQKLVVIKQILPENAQNVEYQEMFVDEARLAGSMAHPNVVQVFDLGSSADGYYLVMEHLAGQDLRAVTRAARLSGQPLAWDFCVRAMIGACEGLHYAHTLADSRGAPMRLVHRDVTPSNLFVTYDGNVKVLDFGIAHAEVRLAKTQDGALKGKFQYMSPEQVKSEPVDGRTDQFALGCVMFELLTGRRLFNQDKELAIMRAVLEDERPRVSSLRPDVPREVDEIVAIATRLDPAQRFPSLDVMRRALVSVLQKAGLTLAPSELAQVMRGLFTTEFAAHTELLAQLPTASPEELASLLAAQGAPQALPGSRSGVGGPPQGTLNVPEAARPDVVARARRRRWLTGAGLGVLVAAGLVAAWFGTRPPLLAALEVRSSPPGARVFIDDVLESQPTPLSRQELRAGPHALRVELDGHVTLHRSVTLVAGAAPERFDFALQPLAALKGTATVMALPATARLTLDGAPVEGPPPWKLAELEAGRPYALVATAEGYEPASASVTVKPGGVEAVQLSLVPVPAVIKTTEPGQRTSVTVALSASRPLQVFWKNKNLGTTPCTATVPTGGVVLTVKDPALGYVGTTRVELTAESTAAVLVLAEGKLAFDVTPWADVFLGDTKLGTTPLAPKVLAAGTYRVKLVNPELGAIKSLSVQVTAGKVNAVHETMGN